MNNVLMLGVAAVAAVWAMLLLPVWSRRSTAQGGRWYLSAILWVCGPLLTVVIKFYPPDLSGPLPALGGALNLLGIVLGILAIVGAIRTPRRATRWIAAALGIYYLTLLTSGALGVRSAFPEVLLVTPLLVFPFALHGGFTFDWFVRAARNVLRTMLAASLVLAVFAPVLAFNSVESRTVFGLNRLEGITTHPNTLAMLAVLAILLELFTRGRWWWTVISFVCVVLAQSNTATVSLLVAILFMSGFVGRWLRIIAAGALVTVGVIAIISPSVRQTLLESLLPANVETLNGRTTIWSLALQSLDQSPWFGYGPTFLGDEFRNRYFAGGYTVAAQAHNEFVQTLGVAGYVGLAALVVLLLVLLVTAWRNRRVTGGLTLAMFILLLGRSVTEASLYPFGVYVNTLLPIIVIGVIAASTTAQSTTDTPSSATAHFDRARDARHQQHPRHEIATITERLRR